MTWGMRAAPRGKAVLEMRRPTVLVLKDVHQPFVLSHGREANYRFGLVEAMWMLSGSESTKTFVGVNPRMLEFSDDGKTLWGAYGPRIIGQLDHVLSTLRRDPDSRQAVITTWRPQVRSVDAEHQATVRETLAGAGLVDTGRNDYADDEDGTPPWDGSSWRSKDVPCTVAWHFQIRDGRLNLSVFMRSNDVWLGLPYDILSFTTVQRVVASALGVEAGEYVHIADNLHLYEEHFEAAKTVLDEPDIAVPYVGIPEFGDHFFGCSADDIRVTFETAMKLGPAGLDPRVDSSIYRWLNHTGMEPFLRVIGAGPGTPHPLIRRIRAASTGRVILSSKSGRE